MVRPILPKHERQPSPNLSSSARELTPEGGRTTKRRCISSACLPCRRRKSKCDGASPACSTCAAVYQMECVYDTESDRRRKTTLKRDMEQLKEKTDTLYTTIALIRSAPDEEVSAIVDHIRAHGSLQNLPEKLKERASSEGVNDAGLLEVDEGGHLRHFGRRASLSAIHAHPHRPPTPRQSRLREGPWTNVTEDSGFIKELIGLYFTWHHPVHVLLSKNCFLNDMEKGRSKYCSPLLVNAILSLACHYTSRPEVRSDLGDPSTCGDHFFREAKALLLEEEEDNPSITVAQALGIMSLREAGKGRDSSGWMYAGRAIRVAMDLGLQIPINSETGKHFSHSEIEVRKITLWGLYLIDKLWCMQFGRLPQLPSSFVGVPKPIIIPPLEKENWPPSSNSGTSSYLQTISIQSYALAEILDQILFAQQSPREPPPSMLKVQCFHERLTQWREQLPPHLEIHERSTPAVLCLHMFYYSILLFLFRPVLLGPASSSGILRARDICNASANHLCNIFFHYQSAHYDERPISAVSNMVLSAALYHLDDFPIGIRSFEQCTLHLQKLGKTWEVANQALRALHGHAKAANGDGLVDERLLALFDKIDSLDARRSISSDWSQESGISSGSETNTDSNLGVTPQQFNFTATNDSSDVPNSGHSMNDSLPPSADNLSLDLSSSPNPPRARPPIPTMSLADHPAFAIDPTVPRTFIHEDPASGPGYDSGCQGFMTSLGMEVNANTEEEWLKGVEAAASAEIGDTGTHVMSLMDGSSTDYQLESTGLGVGLETVMEEDGGLMGMGRWT